jgi:hypothetical protein
METLKAIVIKLQNLFEQHAHTGSDSKMLDPKKSLLGFPVLSVPPSGLSKQGNFAFYQNPADPSYVGIYFFNNNAWQFINGRPLFSGNANMVGGTVTVSTPEIGANDVVLLTSQDAGVIGVLSVPTRVVGTSFDITSQNPTDAGVVGWVIIKI